jgi:hypothetical protein
MQIFLRAPITPRAGVSTDHGPLVRNPLNNNSSANIVVAGIPPVSSEGHLPTTPPRDAQEVTVCRSLFWGSQFLTQRAAKEPRRMERALVCRPSTQPYPGGPGCSSVKLSRAPLCLVSFRLGLVKIPIFRTAFIAPDNRRLHVISCRQFDQRGRSKINLPAGTLDI